jgi:arginyl-tRNA synthetase
MSPAELADAVLAAVRDAVDAGELKVAVPKTVTIERSRGPEHGDYASNVALQLAKPAGRKPREVAEVVAGRLRGLDGLAKIDIAGPGFLNLFLADDAMGSIARTVVRTGSQYGHSATRTGVRVNLEFVSANPTGPITLASSRWAAVGDALARLLEAAGYDVGTEYYINDAGNQIEKFGASLRAAARGKKTPEDGYAGAYVKDVAAQVVADNPGATKLSKQESIELFTREGIELMLQSIKASLRDFGVEFDTFFSEQTLHDSGALTAAVDRLKAQGNVYERDGAVWLRTTDFGDDKDRVLVRGNGELTYFAADAAYYLNKRERGFDRCVYMLGADHHGYVGRLKAIAAAFGDDPMDTLEVLIGQFVNLIKDGKPVKMSKRKGNFLTLDDLVDAVGVDAARYSMVRASTDSTLDLDIDVLTRQSSDNPVWYVQYVHARTAGIRRGAEALGVKYDLETVNVGLLSHDREGDLLRALGEFPRVVAGAAELRGAHRVARYLEEDVAPAFHRFYDSCQVLPKGDEPAGELHAARLLLVDATRTVVENGLSLLGVSAPDRM